MEKFKTRVNKDVVILDCTILIQSQTVTDRQTDRQTALRQLRRAVER